MDGHHIRIPRFRPPEDACSFQASPLESPGSCGLAAGSPSPRNFHKPCGVDVEYFVEENATVGKAPVPSAPALMVCRIRTGCLFFRQKKVSMRRIGMTIGSVALEAEMFGRNEKSRKQEDGILQQHPRHDRKGRSKRTSVKEEGPGSHVTVLWPGYGDLCDNILLSIAGMG